MRVLGRGRIQRPNSCHRARALHWSYGIVRHTSHLAISAFAVANVALRVWALAFAVGPIIGGAMAEAGAWRWIFFLNLPICAMSATTVFFFLKVKTPTESFRHGIMRMDWQCVLLFCVCLG